MHPLLEGGVHRRCGGRLEPGLHTGAEGSARFRARCCSSWVLSVVVTGPCACRRRRRVLGTEVRASSHVIGHPHAWRTASISHAVLPTVFVMCSSSRYQLKLTPEPTVPGRVYNEGRPSVVGFADIEVRLCLRRYLCRQGFPVSLTPQGAGSVSRARTRQGQRRPRPPGRALCGTGGAIS